MSNSECTGLQIERSELEPGCAVSLGKQLLSQNRKHLQKVNLTGTEKDTDDRDAVLSKGRRNTPNPFILQMGIRSEALQY